MDVDFPRFTADLNYWSCEDEMPAGNKIGHHPKFTLNFGRYRHVFQSRDLELLFSTEGRKSRHQTTILPRTVHITKRLLCLAAKAASVCTRRRRLIRRSTDAPST